MFPVAPIASVLFCIAVTITSLPVEAVSKGEQISGKVVRVADGDTLTLLSANREQHRIRLAEIDAPESGQAYGRKSRESLSRLCASKSASVRVSDVDRYDRIVGRVICSGVDTTAEQVRTGMAWVYDSYVVDRSLYRLQESARSSGVGLWADTAPIEPWRWRKGHRGVEGGALVQGNKNSKIYHASGCPGYGSMRPKNVVEFNSEAEAIAAGYRKARNCR